MQIQLRYFASLREALGPGEKVELPAGMTVAAVRDLLVARGGAHAQVLARGRALRCAVNKQIADEHDALQGDASLFTRADEVEEAWSIVDPIVEAWSEEPAPDFPNYDAGTWGPAAADELLTREGRRWRRI